MGRLFSLVAAVLFATFSFCMLSSSAKTNSARSQKPMFAVQLAGVAGEPKQPLAFRPIRSFAGVVKTKIYVVSGASETINRNNQNRPFRNGANIGWFSNTDNGASFVAVYIKNKRKQNVRFKIVWTLGKSKGQQIFVFTPQMK